VIGRTRHAGYPRIGRAATILTNDNAALKSNFLEITRSLVAAGLRDLGLLGSQQRSDFRPHPPAPLQVRGW
jgi:hypothetical protein